MISTPSLRSGAALACLSLLAQPIMAATFSNGTMTSTARPEPTGSGIASVPAWVYFGCESDSAQFPGFTLALSSPSMNVGLCTAKCGAFKYAGLYNTDCYCGNTLDGTTTRNPDSACNIKCPGVPAFQSCGGNPVIASKRENKRAIPGPVFISLYEQIVPPAGIVYTTVLSTTYLSICPTGYSTIPYTQTLTLTHCGCPNPTKPTIPMVPVTTSCPVCPGAPSSVVITIPLASCTTCPQPPAITTPAVVTPGVVGCPGAGVCPPAVTAAVCPAGSPCPVGTGSVTVPPGPKFTGGASGLKIVDGGAGALIVLLGVMGGAMALL